MSTSAAIVQRLLNYCITLRGDGRPDPGLIAAEIVEDLEAALEQFRLVAEELEPA